MKTNLSRSIVFLLAGLLIGGVSVFLILSNSASNSDEQIAETEVKVIKEKVVDTVVIQKKVYIDTTAVAADESDSLAALAVEMLAENSRLEDSLYMEAGEEDLIIVSDRLIFRRTVPIVLEEMDTVDVAKLLDRKAESYGESIAVEYWDSPLDLIGYELSRSRLKLFGFNTQDPIEIRRSSNSDQLRVQMGSGSGSFTVVLEKSNRFKTLLLR
jgi:hypothetical protein